MIVPAELQQGVCWSAYDCFICRKAATLACINSGEYAHDHARFPKKDTPEWIPPNISAERLNTGWSRVVRIEREEIMLTATRTEAMHYLKAQLSELRKIAQSADLDMAAYLIDMASVDLEDALRTAQNSKVAANRNSISLDAPR